MRSNGRLTGGSPVKTVAKCYNVSCAIGYGVLIVFHCDRLTAWCCVRFIELYIWETEVTLEDEGWHLKLAEVNTSQ
jgi:hypothetical protein